MEVVIIDVRLDLGAGRRGTDMGPSAIAVAGIDRRIRALGHVVVGHQEVVVGARECADIQAENANFLTEITAVAQELQQRVFETISAGYFPLVLGGDHALAVGSVSGLTRLRPTERLGLLWVDAHTDMNTPDSSPSGNIHGMPLATLLGDGPAPLVQVARGGNGRIRPEDVVIFGVRSVDPAERIRVDASGVRVYSMSEIDRRGMVVCLTEAMERINRETYGFHLSFDLDGIDPSAAPGVGTPEPGGLTVRESHLLCELCADSGRLTSMDMVELNPTLDQGNATAELAVWLIESALGRTII
jgi:arginase